MYYTLKKEVMLNGFINGYQVSRIGKEDSDSITKLCRTMLTAIEPVDDVIFMYRAHGEFIKNGESIPFDKLIEWLWYIKVEIRGYTQIAAGEYIPFIYIVDGK
jgi:hypothetical protein